LLIGVGYFRDLRRRTASRRADSASWFFFAVFSDFTKIDTNSSASRMSDSAFAAVQIELSTSN
jgi:hypothetical protein